jgi:hypothetical protein
MQFRVEVVYIRDAGREHRSEVLERNVGSWPWKPWG